MKKLLVWLILAGMFLSMAGCSEQTVEEETQAETVITASESETAAEETEETYAEYMPSANYDGADFCILSSPKEGWALSMVDSEESTGEIYNDTIFNRNLKIEDLLGVNIYDFDADAINVTIKKAISAGDTTYSIAYPNLGTAAPLIISGSFIDLMTMDGLQLDMPWWDKASIDALSLCGKLYFAENEINIQYNEATWVIYFNKNLIETFSMESPYELVRENEWTMDKMYDMMGVVAHDANGDGTLTIPEDYFGFATHSGSYLGFLSGAGQQLVSKNEEGMLVPSMANEKMVDIAAKIGQIINDKEKTAMPDRFSGGAWNSSFLSGHALFFGEVVGSFAWLRDMEHNFGLIPFPKYETSQEYYTCYILATARCYTVPISNGNLKMTADVTEALAIESLNTLRPAYLDTTITGKSMRDEDSREMLEIIMEYRGYQLGEVYGWSGCVGTFTSAVDKGESGYMSTIATRENMLAKAIKKTMDFYSSDAD